MTTNITYQPQTIAEIVFGNDESRMMIEDIISGDIPFPFQGKTGILLHGVFGTGKTSVPTWIVRYPEARRTCETPAPENVTVA